MGPGLVIFLALERNNNAVLKPDHVLKTNYRYNTLGQVITQNTPDASDSRFWCWIMPIRYRVVQAV
ncbi:MAG: hypothetical protein ABIQ31_05520 [Ferruginibacter sp.]